MLKKICQLLEQLLLASEADYAIVVQNITR
jgi:hypothetical protein